MLPLSTLPQAVGKCWEGGRSGDLAEDGAGTFTRLEPMQDSALTFSMSYVTSINWRLIIKRQDDDAQRSLSINQGRPSAPARYCSMCGGVVNSKIYNRDARVKSLDTPNQSVILS